MFKKNYQQQLLSYHFKIFKRPIKNNKLDLFGKTIAIIDSVQEDSRIQDIRELDLSHNSIYRIEDICQFYNLECINLSNNKLKDFQQIYQLSKLQKLHTIKIKGNPLLKQNITNQMLPFFLWIKTDVSIFQEGVQTIFDELVMKNLEIQCFNNYAKKLDIFLQLMNQFSMEDTYVNPQVSMFPKIKKIFGESIYKQLQFRRYTFKCLTKKSFTKSNLSQQLQEQIQIIQIKRSQIIKKVYEKQQALKTLRIMQGNKIRPKQIVARNLSFYGNNNNNNSILASSKKQNLFQSDVRQIKRSDIDTTKQPIPKKQKGPSPQKYYAINTKDSENFEQIYPSILAKMNPLYHLLLSPLKSLKMHQKQLLIQNLSVDLKDKMKQIFKYQKMSQEYDCVRADFETLKQHCQSLCVEFSNQQEKNRSKMQKLTQSLLEYELKIQTLCKMLKQQEQQIKHSKNEIEKLVFVSDTSKNTLKYLQQCNNGEEIIKNKREVMIKRKYLRVLNKKSYHLSQLRSLSLKNAADQQNQAKRLIFQELKFFVLLKQKVILLKKRLLKQYSFGLFWQIRENKSIELSKRIAYQLRKIKYSRLFITQLDQKYKDRKQKNENLIQFLSKKKKQIKFTIFKFLKELRYQKIEESEFNDAFEYRKYNSLKISFNKWIKYIQYLNERQHRNISLIKTLKKKAFSSLLICFYEESRTYNSKKIALPLFLQRYRKYFYFNFFHKSLTSTLLKRKIKIMKIVRSHQHKYFNFFISTMRDKRIAKIIQRKREQKRQSDFKKAEKETIKVKKQQKVKKLISLKFIIAEVYKKKVRSIILRTLNEEKLWKRLYEKRAYLFYSHLKSFTLKNTRHYNKVNTLIKSRYFLTKIKQFFTLLSQNSFGRPQNIRTMTFYIKLFYVWKIKVLKNKISDYSKQFFELQPQIENITQMQRQANNQRILLMRQLQDKNVLILQYQKRMQQFEYIIKSKQQKYQKLKELYAQVIYSEESLKTPKFNQKIPERDISQIYARTDYKNTYGIYNKISQTEDKQFLRNFKRF